MIGFIKKYKLALIAAAAIITVLAVAFITGGNPSAPAPDPVQSATKAVAAADSAQTATHDTKAPTEKPTEKEASTAAATQNTTAPTVVPSTTAATVQTEPHTEKATTKQTKKQSSQSARRTTTDKYKTQPVPQGKPEPVEPQEQTVADSKTTVTLSISCASVLKKLDKLDSDKLDIIPKDGWILKPVTININKGESVFDVTKRVCIDRKIHMEFSMTPIYNSAYIEGIGNLYEFDCGSGSGWMYKIDDWFPNYGCSRYVLNGGETISWLYTTDIGKDIGGGNGQWSE